MTVRAALAVALTFLPASLAHPAPAKPGLNACAMVPAHELTAAGVTSGCRHDAIAFGRYGLRYEAAWNRPTSKSPSAYLGVSIVAFFSTSSSGYEQARRDLALARLKRVSGIGSVAYEAVNPDQLTGRQSAQVDFVAGSRIVSIGLDSPSPIRTLAPLRAIAKSVAKKI